MIDSIIHKETRETLITSPFILLDDLRKKYNLELEGSYQFYLEKNTSDCLYYIPSGEYSCFRTNYKSNRYTKYRMQSGWL